MACHFFWRREPARPHSVAVQSAVARAPCGRTVVLHAFGVGCIAALLVACSPTFDWRTVSDNAGGYMIELPARPGNDQRQIHVAGMSLTMRMQTAEAGDTVFAIGSVTLPHDDPRLQGEVLAFLQDGLARNLGGRAEPHAVHIPVVGGRTVEGTEIVSHGGTTGGGPGRTLRARFVAHGIHVYQAVAVGATALPSEQRDQFFRSFVLQ